MNFVFYSLLFVLGKIRLFLRNKMKIMVNEYLDKVLVDKAKDILCDADKIVLIGHIGPDGDAVGATLGLSSCLSAAGKNCSVMYPDSFPDNLNWLIGAENAFIYDENKKACSALLNSADVIVYMDFNENKRIGSLGEVAFPENVKKIAFDHHPYPKMDVDVFFSNPELSSTSELASRFIIQAGYFDKTPDTALEALLVGMITDTGGFAYNSNDPDLYYILYKILDRGIDKDDIYNKIFNNNTLCAVKLKGFVLYNRMKVFKEKGAAVIHLTKKDLSQFDYKKGDTEGFVNIPLSIKDIFFSVFLREDDDKVKISFRSSGDFAINGIASELFGGGGHKNAAGAEYYGHIEDAVKIVENYILNATYK